MSKSLEQFQRKLAEAAKKGGGGNFGPRLAGALKSMGVGKKAIATGDVTKSEYSQAAAIVNSGKGKK